MRLLCVVVCSLGLALGCGGSSKDPVVTGASGSATAGSDSGSVAGTGSGGSDAVAGSSSSAGAASGGAGSTGGGVATAGQSPVGGVGGVETGDGGDAGSAASGLVDCDARKVTCKRAAPQCSGFEVPRVEGTCYGECVKIDRCACSSAQECPDPGQFTCWSKTHCGPYVK